MRDDSPDPEAPWASFGPYTVSRETGTVFVHGEPLALDAGGFAILALLVEARGLPVSTADLLDLHGSAGAQGPEQLWDAVASLNHVLGAQARDAGHVAHHPSEGFSLVSAAQVPAERPSFGAGPPLRRPPISPRLARIFGRDDAIQRVAAQVKVRRFVSIVGPGGMGKTTVALAAADLIGAQYRDGACFVDLAPLSEGRLVQGAVCAALGIPVSRSEIDLAAHLRGRQLLLILDSCEPVVAAVAALVESFYSEALQVHVLATSREPLRAMGEWVYRLGPIPLPARSDDISAAEAATSPGIQLFVERARASHGEFHLTDVLAPAVVGICRRLDGIPLAIELAAARVGLLGVTELAAQFENRLLLLTGSRRDRPRRHRTIETLLDWSYDLLSSLEQTVLRRLSVFSGTFMLDSAALVATDERMETTQGTEALLDLVAKSLVTGVVQGGVAEYRLADITRAYVGAKLAVDPDRNATRRRHAVYMRQLLMQAEVAWDHMTRPQWRSTFARWVNDVRSAIDWAFSNPQDAELAIELTNLSFALADQTSLMPDFGHQVARSLKVLRGLPDPPHVLTMRLSTLPVFLKHFHVLTPQAEILAALDLAERIGEAKYQAGPLTALWAQAFQMGTYSDALRWCQRIFEVAQRSGDPILAFIAQRIGAQTHHFLGRHDTARRLAEEVLANGATKMPLAYFPSAVDSRVSMRVVLARVLWMQGRADSAVRMVDECLQHAQADTPSSLCQALALAAVPVAIWCGDHALARQHLDRLREHLEAYPFDYWRTWSAAFGAVLRDAGPGPALLANPKGAAESYKLGDLLPTFPGCAVDATTLARVRRGEVGWCAPEVLRVHADAIGRGGSPRASDEATALLEEALALARTQAALAWELRAATSLCELWKGQGRLQAAHDVLSDVRQRFVETGNSTDLMQADALLADLARALAARA